MIRHPAEATTSGAHPQPGSANDGNDGRLRNYKYE